MAPDRAENTGSLTVSTYTAEDPEMGSVTLSLSGDDSGMFELNDPDSAVAGSKVLAFKSAPDFENPADSNRDNIYEVTVEASDGTNTAMRDVTVKVTDSDENGKVTLSTQDPLIGVPITATLADPDGSIANVIWEWERDDNAMDDETNMDDEAIIDKATSDTYTPVRADNGMHLRARATYIDRTYDDMDMTFSKMATSASSTQVRDDPGNQRPEFDEGSATERFVLENTGEGMNIGAPVTADDADADVPTYSLGGTDMASFSIMGDTGQLMTKAKLNYEMKNSYRVTVTANDSSGEANGTATITVTIRVIDQDERPTISGSQDPKHAENDMGTVATFTAVDPEGVAPIVWSVDPADFPDRPIDVNGDGDTNDDVDVVADDMEDNARFKISNAGVLTFKEAPNFEAENADNSADNDNNYQVVVQASDGATMETLSWYKVTVEVTDVEETGKVTWMVDPVGDPTVQALLQFQAGADSDRQRDRSRPGFSLCYRLRYPGR